MKLLFSYKKTLVYSIVLTLICSVLLIALTLTTQNLIAELSLEVSLLTFGLVLFSKFEQNSRINEFIKGLFITLFYGITIGSLTQALNPTSELKSLASFFLFSLTYNYIIFIGLIVLLLKFAYNIIYSKRTEQEKE